MSGFDYKNIDGETEHTTTLFEAINMNLIPKEHALRLLEAQRVTGGLIDPNKNYRIDTLKKAVFAGLISQKIADELEKDSPTFKGMVILGSFSVCRLFRLTIFGGHFLTIKKVSWT